MEASFARSILLDAPMAVVAIDHIGQIKASNATAEAFFGRILVQDPPVPIAMLIPDLDSTQFETPEKIAAFNSSSRSAGEGVYRRANIASGAEAFVDVQAAPFLVRGEPFVTLFIHDMTAVAEAQKALQDLRTEITYNWRLNSLGEMASMIAHELNQPLAAIMNYLAAATGLLERPERDVDKALRLMGSALAQTERACDVIRRLRSLMSRDKGFHASENVSEVVDEIMPILRLQAREVGGEIETRVGADDVARCDRVQLQQLILNLTRNALEAPGCEVPRKVAVSGAQTTNGYRIEVCDNGPGVADDVKEKLFDPLVSSKPGGMGLGLSICRTIVEAHGGNLMLTPSPMGGAAFVFTLQGETADV